MKGLISRVLAGLGLFLCVEGVLFRTDLYPSILEPDSYAGLTESFVVGGRLLSPREDRCAILVVGHSSVFFAFSAAIANQMTQPEGFQFINAATPISSLRSWYYQLREFDPDSDRYRAVVLPMTSYDDWHIQWTWREIDEIRLLVPLLRYTDLPTFVGSYERPMAPRALSAVLLKGSAYREDIQAFLQAPVRRMASVARRDELLRETAGRLEEFQEEEAKRENDSLAGVTYDARSDQVLFADGLPFDEQEREDLTYSIRRMREDVAPSASFEQRWLERIVGRYSGTNTRVILYRLPIPFPSTRPRIPAKSDSVVRSMAAQHRIVLLPEDLFVDLERPEYFSDTRHMNEQGRNRFSPILAREVARKLECNSSY